MTDDTYTLVVPLFILVRALGRSCVLLGSAGHFHDTADNLLETAVGSSGS